MKFFSTIFAVYIMALFLTPCADRLENSGGHEHVHSSKSAHQHDSNTEDMCTPFCVCSCCGAITGIVLGEPLSEIGRAVSFDLAKFMAFFKPGFIPQYSHDIWQPPKINA